jgi:pyruvate dehydrogenase (quinone)
LFFFSYDEGVNTWIWSSSARILSNAVGKLPDTAKTEFKNPNFAAMAESVGIRGIRLEDAADVELGLRDAFAHNGPVLVDAVVNRQELAIPPKVTAEMAKGFTLYMVKAVMNGRTDEVIELAPTNLWR